MSNSVPEVHSMELPVLQENASSGAPLQVRMQALAGVTASVTVVAGQAQSTVGELLSLREGQVLAMDKALNAPFDLVLNGTVIARGQLVAVGDQLGIKLTQVQSEGTWAP